MEISVDPNLQREVLARIDTLATKLGTTADHMYSVLLRQAEIIVIEDILIIAGVLGITACMAKLFFIIKKRTNNYEGFSDPFIAVLYGITATLNLGGLIFGLPFVIDQLLTVSLNPEFWALSQVLDLFKK